MSKKKTKFQLGDHVEYSNKTFGYSYKGVVIAKDGRYILTKTYERQGNLSHTYIGTKFIDESYDYDPSEFSKPENSGLSFFEYKTIDDQCVWDSSRYLRHVMKPYEHGQNGDTDDDI